MKTRKKIKPWLTGIGLVMEMGEGAPGAIAILTQILAKDPVRGVLLILSLDDMNIRGTQIWVGFKDFCGENIDDFVKAIHSRDKAMVDVINKECAYLGEIAVVGGSSFS